MRDVCFTFVIIFYRLLIYSRRIGDINWFLVGPSYSRGIPNPRITNEYRNGYFLVITQDCEKKTS